MPEPVPTNYPALFVVMGLPASGKTTLARALALRTGALHLSSDAIRTELKSRGLYDTFTKDQVYEEMYLRARQALTQQRTVVADATFHVQAKREKFSSLAASLSVPYFLINVQASEELTRQRLSVPRSDSEATWDVYTLLKATYEPPQQPTLTLCTDATPTGQLVEEVLKKIHYTL